MANEVTQAATLSSSSKQPMHKAEEEEELSGNKTIEKPNALSPYHTADGNSACVLSPSSNSIRPNSSQTPGASLRPNPSITSYSMQLPLSPTLMRNLGDRSYDKRKGAAMELENLIKQWQEMEDKTGSQSSEVISSPTSRSIITSSVQEFNRNRQRISAVIDLLGKEFACSTNANHRKGGLIGLAATAIGLMHEAHSYLNKLLPPVLHCFDDPESRVRYYACESLYNIAKVARGHILHYFNQIFDGLCKVRTHTIH